MAKMRALCSLLVLVVFVAAGADALNCTTNESSPAKVDARNAVESIFRLGDNECCQHNCEEGWSCSVLKEIGEARLLMCGDCHKCTNYTTVAKALATVVTECRRRFGNTVRCSGSEEDPNGFLFEIVAAAPRVTNGFGDPIDREKRTSV